MCRSGRVESSSRSAAQRGLDYAVLAQKRFLVAGHPTEDFRTLAKVLNQVVNVEVYRAVGPITAGIDCSPGHVGDAVEVVDGGDADVANRICLVPMAR